MKRLKRRSKRGTKELQSCLNVLNATIIGLENFFGTKLVKLVDPNVLKRVREEQGLPKDDSGHQITLPYYEIENLGTLIVEPCWSFINRLYQLTEALGPPIQIERICELVQQEMERSPLRVEFDPISRTPRYNSLFMATLFPALPFFAEGWRYKCKQCNKLMLARGETKRFCSDACRYKAFPKRPYDPNNESVKHYRKWYQKLVVRGDMPLDDFRKEYKTILENEKKEEIKHGKKNKIQIRD